jgi:hypothetical protein
MPAEAEAGLLLIVDQVAEVAQVVAVQVVRLQAE